MKTQEEIVARIDEVTDRDFLGFEMSDLYNSLNKENLIETLLKLGSKSTREELEKEFAEHKPVFQTDEDVVAEIKRYMDFAIGKAVNHRGISTCRSISHYRTWTWFIDDKETYDFLKNDDNYRNYGAPMLKFVAEKYGCPLPDGEDGQVFEAMANGEMCLHCINGDQSGCDK